MVEKQTVNECGQCTLCSEYYAIFSFDKHGFGLCDFWMKGLGLSISSHQSPKGRDFICGWLHSKKNEDLAHWFPPKCKMIINIIDDWVRTGVHWRIQTIPQHKDNWRSDPYLSDLLAAAKDPGILSVVVQDGEDAWWVTQDGDILNIKNERAAGRVTPILSFDLPLPI